MSSTRRGFLWAVTVAVLLGCPDKSFAAKGADVVRRPNVVFLFADQWRATATGYAGDPNVRTPNLDKLAKEGVNFTTAVSVCPVCTPYRAALLTGRYPTSTGMFMNDLYLPDQELCMGEIFKEAGYSTAYIGKWHLDGHGRSSYIPPERRQGFDYWKVAECDHNYPKSHYYTGNSPEKKFWEGYDAFAQTKDAAQYIRDHAKDGKPFVLVVSYGTPHFPHQTALKEYLEMYPPETLKLAPNIPEKKKDMVLMELPGYYAHCTALDKCIGEVVKTLQETGLDGNTILVFTSDHGEMMGAHDVGPCTKQYPFDESSRVPFLLRYPEVQGKNVRSVKTPINTPDILPTLLGLAGVAIPKTVEGEDLSGLVKGTAERPEKAALIMSVSPFAAGLKEYRGIRTSRHTYVNNLDGAWLLYDNQEDPWQMNNLAGKQAYTELQKKLDNQLQSELKKVGDNFQPRKFYLDKWGYKLSGNGAIPYNGNTGQGRFVDAHIHFHACKAGELDKVVDWMKSNNVQRILNYPLAQSRPKNEVERKQMLANYAKYKGRIARACVIFPEEVNSVDEAVKLLTMEKQDGAVVFGEHYGSKLMFDDPKNMRLYEACEKVGLPVMFHMDRGQNLDEKGLPRLENVLKAYPKCILIAHSDWWRNLGDGTCDRLLKSYPNLYADISCTVGRSVIGRDNKFAREFFIRNADKLLFGTDSGWWSLGKDKKPAPEFALIDELDLSADVIDKICRKNAERLFWGGKAGDSSLNVTTPPAK